MRIHEKPAKSIAQALNRAMEALVKDEYLKHTNVNAQALCLEDTSNENMVRPRKYFFSFFMYLKFTHFFLVFVLILNDLYACHFVYICQKLN